jgi:hypothetical protein
MMKKIILATLLSLVLVVGFALTVMAGDLPKEGPFSLTIYGMWTGKAIVVGERLHCIYDGMGIVVNDEGKGFLNDVAFYTLGQMHGAKGIKESENGVFEYSDADGDKILATYEWKGVLFKSSEGPFKFVGGTGKYAGITGGGESTWRPTVQRKEEMYPGITNPNPGVLRAKGHYKLP